MRRLPKINTLKAFEAAARYLSLTKAADELNVTASAMSQQVRQLEDQLGVQLFDRLVTGLALTDEGKAFLPYIKRAFQELDQGLSVLDDPDLPRTLKLLVLSSFAIKWLGPRLGEFAEKNSHIDISLFHNHVPPDFGTTDFDLAILWGDGNWPGCESYFLMGEYIFPICSPEFKTRHSAPLKKESGDIILLTTAILSEWPIWLNSIGLNVSSFKSTRIFDDGTMMIDAAIDGQGLGLARSVIAYDALAENKLVRPYETTIPSPFSYYLVLPENERNNPAVDEFMEWIAQRARECIAHEDKLFS